MQDTNKLFETVLGLQAPWRIGRVALDPEAQRIDLWAEHGATRWPCPECGQALAGWDHAEERTWRHLDTCQFETHLHARIPRVQCPTHGVKQVHVPWAAPRSRFTMLMERLIIDVIHQCSTLSGARRLLRISWDEAWGVMDRAVRRGQARKPARLLRYVGVDEKAFRKGHVYHTVVCDLERSTVEYVGEGRGVESLAPFYAGLTDHQREALQAVAMDMWDPYIKATREGLPDGAARIVFDRFHVMRDMTTAVDLVRKQEHRTLLRETGDSVLTGTKYLWLYGAERLPTARRGVFRQLRAMNLKVGRAWAIKEALRTLWTYRQAAAVARFFRHWYGWARRSQLEPIKRAAATLRRHLAGVLRYCRHRITNGVAEGLNSKIMTIKRKACGFRNPQHFTTAIYFHCGGLDLYPR
ncbi:MAG: ISL3 family transposase [Acidobacteria bacterium]|nr:ISL3 family transposase [Acidobacteriota bacterium]